MLIIAGIILLLAGLGFGWLNANTPIQTPLPIVLVPSGTGLLLFGLGGLLL